MHFKGVEDGDRLERILGNNIYIQGIKMFVNKPKYQRTKKGVGLLRAYSMQLQRCLPRSFIVGIKTGPFIS